MSSSDEKKESSGADLTTAEETGDAKQTLKDLIHITQGESAEDIEVDDDEDFVDLDEESDKHPVFKTVDDLTTSVRGTLEKHVAPKVDEFVSNTQYLLDTHVAPKIKEVQSSTDKIVKTTQEHTGKFVKDVQQHSSRAVQGVQEHSTRAMKGVQENTQKTLKGVQEHSSRAIQAVDKSTKEFHSTHVAPKIEKATKDIGDFHSSKVKPHVDKALQESKRAMDETGGCLNKSWKATKDFVIQHKPYYWNTAPDLFDAQHNVWYLQLEEGVCRAYSRVLFCDNPVSGLLIFLGILVASPLAALCSLCAVVMANLTALYFDMDREQMRRGFYAYNAVCVGTAMVDFVTFNTAHGSGWAIQVFLSIFLAPITLMLQLWMKHRVLSDSTPYLMLPYNIIIFVVLLSAKVWDSTIVRSVDIFDESMLNAPDDAERYYGYKAVLNGIARCFLVNGPAAGALILIGICCCSRILALSVVAGSFVASLLAMAVFDVPDAYLNAGYMGFNPANAMAGIFFYLVPSWKLTGLAFFWLILTMISTNAVDVLLDVLGIPVALTFGYCFALLPLLALDPQSVFGPNHTLFRRIPADELTCPEEYLEKSEAIVVKDVDDDEDEETGNAGDDSDSGELVEVQNESTPLLSSS